MTAEADSYDRWTAARLYPIDIVSIKIEGRGRVMVPWNPESQYTTEKAADLIATYIFQEAHENFVQVVIDDRGHIMGLERLSTGVHNRAIMDSDQVFILPAALACARIVIGHNHAIGSLEPSSFDLETTRVLVKDGRKRPQPIAVYDHIITGCQPGEYFSFREHRLLGRRRLSANPWASPAVAAARAYPAPPAPDGLGDSSVVA